MNFKEQSKENVETRNYEIEQDGYRYELKLISKGTDKEVEMEIYKKNDMVNDDGSVSSEVSAFPVGRILQRGTGRNISMAENLSVHITIFEEFLKTI